MEVAAFSFVLGALPVLWSIHIVGAPPFGLSSSQGAGRKEPSMHRGSDGPRLSPAPPPPPPGMGTVAPGARKKGMCTLARHASMSSSLVAYELSTRRSKIGPAPNSEGALTADTRRCTLSEHSSWASCGKSWSSLGETVWQG